ncbi:polymorphic toxin-type HINT domain-containing protein [Colwelliaceae bacterium 6441]
MTITSLSPSDQAILQKVIAKYQNKGAFVIEPNDKDLVCFYDGQLALAGVAQTNYQKFFNVWQETKSAKKVANTAIIPQGKFVPVHCIASFNSSDGITYNTTAVSSLPNTATNVTQTLGIFNNNAQPIGKVALKKNYQDVTDCVINASGQCSNKMTPSSEALTVIYTYSQTVNSNTVYSAEIMTTVGYPKIINNIAPTDVNKNSEIKICLTRVAEDCDYTHDYNGVVSVPIQGSIEYFDNIDMADKKPINAACAIYLIKTTDGGSPIRPLDAFEFFDNPNTVIADQTLSWNLDWLSFKQPDFKSGEMVYYVFQVTVQINGNQVVSFITNAPKSVVPGQLLLNTLPIKPMQIIYGCLGEDSEILMQDGSLQTIAKITQGDWVRSQDDKSLRVEDVICGSEDEYCEITILDKKEQTIKASLGHPFCTDKGVLLAKELSVDCQLITPDGFVKIKNISYQNKPLDVFNLHLSCDDSGEYLTNENRTMYANNMLVGDSVMQRIWEDNYNLRPENIMKFLDPAWHQDYIHYTMQAH